MAVALNYLRGHRSRLQSEPLADALFVFGFEVAERPTAPDSLPTRISSAAASKRARLRSISAKPVQQFQPKGSRLGMYPMGPANVGVCLNSRARRLSTASSASRPVSNQPGGFLDLQGLGGIDNIVGSEP